jgi:hypothetical protein
MTMFDWSPEGSRPKVSPYLWVYFVIAISLTGILVLLWWIWWRRTNVKYVIEPARNLRKPSISQVRKLESDV